jgi:hypothetical protein
MANLTDRYEKKLADGLTGVTPLTTPTTVYLALFTADPTETGDVTNEVSGTGYARVALTSKFGASADGSSANTAAITFAAAGAGGWGTITHVGLMEAGTAAVADMMLYQALVDPITIAETDVFEFLVGNFTVIAD